MRIFVKAKASAKAPAVIKFDAAHFVVAVKEPPHDNRANAAIAKALAVYFDIAPSRVTLIRGQTVKQKVFEIS